MSLDDTPKSRRKPLVRDLVGEVFGSWTVLSLADRSQLNGKWAKRATHWICRCACGKTRPANSLQRVDRSGETFGSWTVLYRIRDAKWPNGKPATKWMCRCVCGLEKPVVDSALMAGTSGSCQACSIKRRNAISPSRGLSTTRENHSWRGMQQRCYNPKNTDYHNYGKRKISVHPSWLDPDNGFVNFLADMGICPADGYSLDREDNEGNYTPENCRWADPATQRKNRRKTRAIENHSDEVAVRDILRRAAADPELAASLAELLLELIPSAAS